jgi:tRNA (guanine-N7-)-methyltransferase
MSKSKTEKFAEVAAFGNVIQGPVDFKGHWRENHFHNRNQLILELGCGRGEYTIALAQKQPAGNFIGVDLKGARIWKGAKFALESGLTNVTFLRCSIKFLSEYFAPGEIDEIWLPFPDPYPKREQAHKRLTAPSFLRIYENILKKGGVVHLKTDALGLYQYTLATLKADNCLVHEYSADLYAGGISDAAINDVIAIKTKYELLALADSRTIKYVRFGFAG